MHIYCVSDFGSKVEGYSNDKSTNNIEIGEWCINKFKNKVRGDSLHLCQS